MCSVFYIRCGICAITMLIAAITDIHSKRIPNWLTIPAWLIGIGVSVATQDWNFLLYSILACLCLFAVGYFGVMGLGDIKLCIAVSSMLSFKYMLMTIGFGTLSMIVFWLLKYRKAAVKESKNAIFALITLNFQAIDTSGTKMIYAPFLFGGFIVASILMHF